MTKLILLNSEGVLLDYSKGFGEIYQKIFQKKLNVINPYATNINDYYDLIWKDENQKKNFYQQFNDFGGDDLPEVEGAAKAVSLLKKKNYKIIALSHIPGELQEAKHRNLIQKKINVDATIATVDSPREKLIEILKPNYYIDTLPLNFKSSDIKNILIDTSDNAQVNHKYVFKTFKSLEAFALGI